jgi:carboxylesterase type B
VDLLSIKLYLIIFTFARRTHYTSPMSQARYNPSAPYTIDAGHLGFLTGLTLFRPESFASAKGLCHYFGGIPYGLPPIGPFRWKKPRPLPPCYRYGTKANPGVFVGKTALCPQPDFLNDGNPYDNIVSGEEDCLQLNIWIPMDRRPREGWPVLFFIHGGFLQFGSANDLDPAAMLSETECRCIIVGPAYRLNLLGFLASREMQDEGAGVGNLGFWDQRLALEWTWKNVSVFGGNASNITVAGYSAGSHSTFHQLSFDLGLPRHKSVIRRAIMWSNSPGLQPKSVSEIQAQFDELCAALDISSELYFKGKMEALRALDVNQLLKGVRNMKYHQFRAVTDGEFVRKSLFQEIDDGTYAQKMKERGIQLMIGECKDEHFLYGIWMPPVENSFASLATRLEADYPFAGVKTLLHHYYPGKKLPDGCKDWYDAFGRIYADVQVHKIQRGFYKELENWGASDLIHRYRMEWRAKCIDEWIPIEWGVTHSTDMVIWFYGNGQKLEAKEKDIIKRAFTDPLGKFLRGEKEIGWQAYGVREVRRLQGDGSVDIVGDDMWQEGVTVWDKLHKAGVTGAQRQSKL